MSPRVDGNPLDGTEINSRKCKKRNWDGCVRKILLTCPGKEVTTPGFILDVHLVGKDKEGVGPLSSTVEPERPRTRCKPLGPSRPRGSWCTLPFKFYKYSGYSSYRRRKTQNDRPFSLEKKGKEMQ